MKKIKVSACIITYNQESYIKDCLEGAIFQNVNFDYEIIVCDDCSTDGTTAICQEYSEKYPEIIKFFPRKENSGMMPNFLFALQKCNGDYIALCDGDDYWIDPLKLQKQVSFLESNKEYVLCFHKIKILKHDGELVEDFITKVPENYETIEALATHGNYIHTPSVVFRNIKKEYPFEFLETPIGDYFLYMILAENGKLKYLEECMAVYRYGVGYYSGINKIFKVKNELKLFSCLISYIDDVKLKKIMLNRQFQSISQFENVVNQKYIDKFKTHYDFQKSKKYLKSNYKSPLKILKKIIRSLLKYKL